MNVLSIERPMVATLRGRAFRVLAMWTPADPWIFLLEFGNGDVWEFSRDVVARALKSECVPDQPAAKIEIVRTVDSADEVEITRYSRRRRPVSLTFPAGDWAQLLAETLCVVPGGHERAYIDWHAAPGVTPR